MPAIQVIAGDRDITAQHDGLQLSNVDPGGYEVLQLNPRAIDGLRPGAPIWVRLGSEVMGHYRLNEPGEHDKAGRSDFSIAALGFGAKLKDDPTRRLYVDRSLAQWGALGRTRQIALAAASRQYNAPSVVPDGVTGLPALRTALSGPWTANSTSEAIYDAQGLALGAIYYAWNADGTLVSAADANWNWLVGMSSDDSATALDVTADLQLSGNSGSGYKTSHSGFTYGWLQDLYATAAGGNVEYPLLWRLAVYGDHGLPLRGPDPGGFYTSDIVRDAARDMGFELLIDDATGFIVAHSTYLPPTSREQIIADQAKLAGGWHWGVWEPLSIDNPRPTLRYHAPPDQATCVVSRLDCDEFQAPSVRLDQLYDTAIVGYRDPGGSSGYVTVTIANPLLRETDMGSRTLPLDAGIATAAVASVIGTDTLALALASARGSGWAILPDAVTVPGGGRKPACLLKAGRDRIRISDIPRLSSLVDAATQFDTFRISRVEPTIDAHGIPRTRVEFDGGADLMEVLNARLAIAATVAGA